VSRIEILAPMSGRVVQLGEVPDPVFAERMLGDGLAIEPEEGFAVAPVSGVLVVFHSAGHAFAVEEATSGIGILVHVGLDTVQLSGRGFERLAEVGAIVTAGQSVVRFDLAVIAEANLSALSPIILPQLDPSFAVEMTTQTRVRAGQDVILTVETPGPRQAESAAGIGSR
jgi:glucose-specific phosphotransferase system IIA component